MNSRRVLGAIGVVMALGAPLLVVANVVGKKGLSGPNLALFPILALGGAISVLLARPRNGWAAVTGLIITALAHTIMYGPLLFTAGRKDVGISIFSCLPAMIIGFLVSLVGTMFTTIAGMGALDLPECVCAKCGLHMQSLSESRCPKCGTPFDSGSP